MSALLAVLWAALAAVHPTTTFHTAPLIIAAWPALTARDRSTAWRLSLGGLMIAATSTLGLAGIGLLEGPSLFPWGGPLIESLTAAGAGVLLSLVPVLGRRESRQS